MTESNLVAHAKKELALINEEPEIVEGYLKIVQAFADMNHSGGSASVAIVVINELLQFKNLTPLTNDPDEWCDVAEQSGYTLWQNRRNSTAFSNDGGKTYWQLGDGSSPELPYTAADPIKEKS